MSIFGKLLKTGLDASAESGRAAMSEWHRFPAEKPPVGTAVLICAKHRYDDDELVTAAVYSPQKANGREYWWWDAHGYGGYDLEANFEQDAVTHWMRLPELPITP